MSSNPLMAKVMLVDTWLEETLSIKVPVAWLKSCIQKSWELHPRSKNDVELLKAIVFNTWLSTDLREMGCDKLPFGISDKPALTIEGSYNLQIEEIRDVSQSPYDQLKKLLGKENDNVLVNCDATDTTEKASRILMMTVTDGFQTLFAAEFSPIPDLSVNIKPGTKIRVKGPLQCNAATLMLNKDNVVVFGGEVQRLLIKNCQKNVLARALNLEELVTVSDISEGNDMNPNNNVVDEAELNQLIDEFDSDIDLNFIENEEKIALQNSNNAEAIAQLDLDEVSNAPLCPQSQNSGCNETNISINEKRSRLSRKRRSDSQRTMTDFSSQPNNASTTEVKDTSVNSYEGEPYTYLSKVLEKLTEPKIVRVKAFIGSFLSKLRRHPETREWILEVIINDGTMAIKAMISHSILSSLVVPEGKIGVRNVSKVLAQCNTVMKVQLNPPPAGHKVISINEEINLENLKNRLKSDIDLTELGIS